jgi:hypothetical protein
MTTISLTLDLLRLRPDPEDASGVRCPGCRDLLTLDQPDQERPERLLGTCERCRSWFLVHLAARVMVRLPDEDELRDAEPTTLRIPGSGLHGRSVATRG